ncbi:MAG: hypothetical protein AAF657_02300 [Acidobacteriota bacterium]
MDSNGRRPTDFTVGHQDQEKVGLHLLAAGADVSFEGSNRLVVETAGGQKFKLLRALLEAGARPSGFSNHDLLVSLAQQGETRLLKRILSPSNLAHGYSTLHGAGKKRRGASTRPDRRLY